MAKIAPSKLRGSGTSMVLTIPVEIINDEQFPFQRSTESGSKQEIMVKIEVTPANPKQHRLVVEKPQ